MLRQTYSEQVNAETNAGTHTFDRAMSEASDLNDWFNAKIVSADAANRLHFRAASFCMGDATDFDAWDQGICSVVTVLYTKNAQFQPCCPQ